MSRKKDRLVVGETYKMMTGCEGRVLRMELMGVYPNLVVFKRPEGYTQSFTDWELKRCLRE